MPCAAVRGGCGAVEEQQGEALERGMGRLGADYELPGVSTL